MEIILRSFYVLFLPCYELTYLSLLAYLLTCLLACFLAFFFNCLFAIWLDYQEAFGSLPHKWLFKVFELAKVPEKRMRAIKVLMKKYSTNV